MLTAENELREKLVYLVLHQSRTDFLSFVKLVSPELVHDFKMGAHIKVISDKLQQIGDGTLKRLMVFLPPRSSKSLLCSKLFPAWYIGQYPQKEILTVSHSDQLSTDFGRDVRDLINSPTFQSIFPEVKVRSDVRSAGKFMINQGGTYFAAGVKTQIAGRGAHVAILDDVMSEEDAFSEAGRRYIKNWYPSGLRTRLMPGGAIVVINTRYHEDDISGWLLGNAKEGEWEVLKIPAWLDDPSAKLLQLPSGSSYFPQWKPDSLLREEEDEIKRNNGTQYWQSLYMQDPQPQEGGLIKKEWFQTWDESDPPECSYVLQTMDTAFSKRSTADYSVMQTWGIFELLERDSEGIERWISNLILLSNVRGRMEYPELRSTAQDLYDKHTPDMVLIEKKASGQSLIQDLRRAGLPILEYTPDRDKVSRVNAATPLLESGRIWIPEKEWAQELVMESGGFPTARYDDQVDAMTMAILWMKESWRLEHPHDPDFDAPKKKAVAGYWRI